MYEGAFAPLSRIRVVCILVAKVRSSHA